MNRTKTEILFVEDNPHDVKLMRDSLMITASHYQLHIACGLLEAESFLGRQGIYARAMLPHIVIIDVPDIICGTEVFLGKIKKERQLKIIPVLAFVNPGRTEDIIVIYDLHVNAVMKKPVTADDYLSVMGTITNFWFYLAALPGR